MPDSARRVSGAPPNQLIADRLREAADLLERGPLAGKPVVRGREAECRAHYEAA